MKKTILILCVIAIAGCGSRKTVLEKSNIKTDSIIKKKESNVLKTDITLNIDSIADNLIIEPIEPFKPMIINGKTYINAKILSKKTTKKTIKTDKSIKKNNIVFDAKTKSNSVNKAKETKATNIPWYIYLILIVIVLYGIYRFKQKNTAY